MDNLRIAVIVGVIVVHVATTYIVDIDWYYEERTASGLTEAVAGVLFAVGALFGMAVLFLVSGMLSSRSLAKKGGRRFVQERLARFGLPILFYVLVLEPSMSLIGARAQGSPAADRTWDFLWSELWPPGSGVMWFVVALLVFSIAYAAWRAARPCNPTARAPLRRKHLVVAGAAIVVGSFLVRLVWPFAQDTPLALNLWEWPQMATLFVFGAMAGERGSLQPVPAWLRRTCGRWAVAGAVGVVAVFAAISTAEDQDAFLGGWHIQALAEPIVEAVVSITVSIWVLEWFARRWTYDGPLARSLGRSSFAAYFIHAPVIVLLAAALSTVAIAVEIKFLVVATVGVVVSLALGWLLTRVRVLARVF
jgi:fucose 4-O-acetylase-like acetyltransferase